ncbi:PorV/PorQ family protein [Elusimicrobiota bacterium]
MNTNKDTRMNANKKDARMNVNMRSSLVASGFSLCSASVALVVLAVLIASPVLASKKNAGTSGAKFLSIGPGARTAAMGDAFSSVSGDLHNVYYNPAGLHALEAPQASFMHNSYFQSMRYEFLAFASPVRKTDLSKGSFGFAIYNLAIDNIERRTSDTDLAAGTFDASDFAYAFSYGRKLREDISVGGTLKYIRQTIDNVNATAIGADLGGLYKLPERPITASVGIRNIGTQPKFREVSSPLPRVFYLGALGNLITRENGDHSKKLLGAAELSMPRDAEMQFQVGLEFSHGLGTDLLGSLRTGYNSAHTDPGGMAGFSMGAGIGFKRLNFDFAWVPFEDLGDTFRYSLILKF